MISTEQAPGIYRRLVSDVLVTALSDGYLIFPPGLLRNISPDETEAALRAVGRRPPFATAINAFLLQSPGRTVLIDTGCGPLIGPTGGRLMRNLEEAGVPAAGIDAVLMTHLHIDHVGGLLDGAGLPVFTNAKLMVPEAEMAFWSDDAAMAAAPEDKRGSFQLARRTTGAYGDALVRFGGTSPLPGIEAVALPGHTPGHTGYMVGSGPDRLLIWGDVCHAQDIQAPRPEVTLPFDSDPALAAKTRLDIFERAVAEDLLVTGMHMHFPGFSRVARSGAAYVVQPEVWQGELRIG